MSYLKTSIFILIIILIVVCIPIKSESNQERKQFNQFVQGGAILKEEVKVLEKIKSLGEFKISYYNGDGSAIEGGSNNCLGEPLEYGMIAVDTDIIPLGTKVIINGEEFIACDVGGGIHGNHIDMYIPNASQSDLNELGIDYYEVFIEV